MQQPPATLPSVSERTTDRPGVAEPRGGENDVRAAIQRRIIDGRIRPGERIVEQRLAEDLGVSRTPIREALTALMALGQVTRRPSGWETVEYSLTELDDAFQLRAVVESFAAFRAAIAATDEARAAIRAAYERMHVASRRRYDDRLSYATALARLNREFHEAVVDASANRRLPTLLQAIVIGPLVFSAFAWYTKEERERSDWFHGAVCEAVCAGDARRAEGLMAEHILEGRDVVLAHLARGREDGMGVNQLWRSLYDGGRG
jgi:DNA-binding GntR family transcriptional regulator